MGETVTVACKLPHGLVLQLEESFDDHESVMGGGTRKVKRNRKCGKTVEIKGVARYVDAPFDATFSNGFGLTHGVDADFFKKWLEQKKDYPPVAKGMIFAVGDAASANAKTREMEREKSGFEPTDPDNLPEEFRGQIAKADAKK